MWKREQERALLLLMLVFASLANGASENRLNQRGNLYIGLEKTHDATARNPEKLPRLKVFTENNKDSNDLIWPQEDEFTKVFFETNAVTCSIGCKDFTKYKSLNTYIRGSQFDITYSKFAKEKFQKGNIKIKNINWNTFDAQQCCSLHGVSKIELSDGSSLRLEMVNVNQTGLLKFPTIAFREWNDPMGDLRSDRKRTYGAPNDRPPLESIVNAVKEKLETDWSYGMNCFRAAGKEDCRSILVSLKEIFETQIKETFEMGDELPKPWIEPIRENRNHGIQYYRQHSKISCGDPANHRFNNAFLVENFNEVRPDGTCKGTAIIGNIHEPNKQIKIGDCTVLEKSSTYSHWMLRCRVKDYKHERVENVLEKCSHFGIARGKTQRVIFVKWPKANVAGGMEMLPQL